MRGIFFLSERFTYLEEAEQLSAQDGVVVLPRADGRLQTARLQLMLAIHEAATTRV